MSAYEPGVLCISNDASLGEAIRGARERVQLALDTAPASEIPKLDRCAFFLGLGCDVATHLLDRIVNRPPLTLVETIECFAFLHECYAYAKRFGERFECWVPVNSSQIPIELSLPNAHSAIQYMVSVCYTSSIRRLTNRHDLEMNSTEFLDRFFSRVKPGNERPLWPQFVSESIMGTIIPKAWFSLEAMADLRRCLKQEIAAAASYYHQMKRLDWLTLQELTVDQYPAWRREFRAEIEPLLSRLQVVARMAGICKLTDPAPKLFEGLVDWLVVRGGLSLAAAQEMHVISVCERLESAAASVVTLAPPRKTTKKPPPKQITPTERKVFAVIRAAGSITGAAIASKLKRRDDVVGRACQFLTDRGLITNSGQGYSARVQELPVLPQS